MVLSAFQAVWHLSLGSNTVRVYASCYTVALVGLHHLLLSVKCEHPSFLVVDDTIMMLLFLLLSSSSPFSGRGCRPWVDLGHGLLYLLELLSTVLPEVVQFDDLSNVALTRRAITPTTAPLWSQWSNGSWSSSSLKYCTASSIGCRFRRFKQCCFHPTCRRRYPRYWHLHCQLGYMGRQTIIVTNW